MVLHCSVTAFVIILCLLAGNVLAQTNRCLDASGRPKPNAEYCKNIAADTACEADYGPRRAFGVAPDPRCITPTGTPTVPATDCRQTCATCCELPEYDCDNNDNVGTFKCTDNYDSCNGGLRELMIQVCPGTCGFCREPKITPVTTNNNNKDDCKDTIADCDKYKSICDSKQKIIRDTLIDKCPVTCGLCDERKSAKKAAKDDAKDDANAGDLASNCAENSHLCDRNLYRDLMKELCKDTCKDKKSTRRPTDRCYDNNAQCEVWSLNGYCESGFYTRSERAAECAFTCGLCDEQ